MCTARKQRVALWLFKEKQERPLFWDNTGITEVVITTCLINTYNTLILSVPQNESL